MKIYKFSQQHKIRTLQKESPQQQGNLLKEIDRYMKSEQDFQKNLQKKFLEQQQYSESKENESQQKMKSVNSQSMKNEQTLTQNQINQLKKLFAQFRDFKPDKQNKIQLQKPTVRLIIQTIELWKKRPIKAQNYTVTLSLIQPKINKEEIIDLVKPLASLKLIIDGQQIENKQAIHKTQKNTYYEGIDNGYMMITKTNGDTIDIYQGQVKDFVENGEGTLIHMLSNKVLWSYRGQFVAGKRQGFGKQNNSKGINYEGQFKNDFKHGKGVEIVVKRRKHPKPGQDPYVQKNRYVGNFEFGYKEGEGTETTQHGQYQGQWHEGSKHGKGIIKYKKGDSYEGQWLNNCQHGEGTYLQLVMVNGQEKFNKYTGQFKEGYYYGKGVMEYWNGDKYDGQWAFGKKQGQGMYEWSDGDYYDGNWEKDSAEGTGAACFGGVFYDGEFHLGVKHGLGEQTDDEGNTIKAMWQNGKIIKKLQVNGEIVEEEDQ